jgi:predicted RNA methylase
MYNLLNYNIKNIYCCGFIGKDKYEIFKYDFKNMIFIKMNKTINNLLIKSQNKYINNKTKYTPENLDKQIHKIHNYIRENTKISNEDKSLFIGGILICLMNKSFIQLLKNIDNKDISHTIIYELKQKNINISNITSIYKDSLNNIHLLTLTNMLYDTIKNYKNNDFDLLNKFYKEFTSYYSTDSKSLGIVLTPEHIIKIMIKILNINENDIFLDLCCGTGSFPCETLKYKPKEVIACEYQKKLFDLLQINNILRGNLIKCIHNDCFNEIFKVTKTAINPPYGCKDKNEFDFIEKQIESLDENGLCCSIIPISCLTSKKFMKDRIKLSKKCKIIKIIKCSEHLFYPTGTSTIIILLQKNQEGHNFKKDKIIYINYKNDGIILKQNTGLVKMNDFDEKLNDVIEEKNSKYILIKERGEWIYNLDDCEIPQIPKISLYEKKLNELMTEYIDLKNEILLDETNNEPFKFKYSKFIKIEDLFIIKTVRNISLDYVNNNPGKYPYITSTKLNNGVSGYTNIFTNEGQCITINNSGSVGYAFYQKNNFCGNSHIYVLLLKNNNWFDCDNNGKINYIDGIYLSTILTTMFSKSIYNFGYMLNSDRLLNEYIYI